MRFLFAWQHVDPSSRLTGIDGARAIVQVLDGYELAATAWERAIFPSRMDKYDPSMLDMLCLTGQVGWARLSRGPASMVGATPVALFLREHFDTWLSARAAEEDGATAERPLGEAAARVADALTTRGALFLTELATVCGLTDDHVRGAVAELVAAGRVTSDGFAGLRSIVNDAPARTTGRWSLVPQTPSHVVRDFSPARRASPATGARPATVSDDVLETQAWSLLRRYGVVCRRVLARETNLAPWRVLARAYRRLELRGEIRGGRFVAGLSGEQFALPEAVTRLRETRRTPPDGRLTVISGADPLNLAGIVTVGDRVRAIAGTRIVYRDGVPLAALEGDYVKKLAEIDPSIAGKVATALAGRPVPPVISGYIGRAG